MQIQMLLPVDTMFCMEAFLYVCGVGFLGWGRGEGQCVLSVRLDLLLRMSNAHQRETQPSSARVSISVVWRFSAWARNKFWNVDTVIIGEQSTYCFYHYYWPEVMSNTMQWIVGVCWSHWNAGGIFLSTFRSLFCSLKEGMCFFWQKKPGAARSYQSHVQGHGCGCETWAPDCLLALFFFSPFLCGYFYVHFHVVFFLLLLFFAGLVFLCAWLLSWILMFVFAFLLEDCSSKLEKSFHEIVLSFCSEMSVLCLHFNTLLPLFCRAISVLWQ